MNCLVSIIIPTKNSEKFIGSCLESIKNQKGCHPELACLAEVSTEAGQSIASGSPANRGFSLESLALEQRDQF